jgi:hypothetical protein
VGCLLKFLDEIGNPRIYESFSFKLIQPILSDVLEHIFHLFSLNISPRYSRAWSHDVACQNLTSFHQVSHSGAPSLYFGGNLIFLANGGTLLTLFLDFNILIYIFGILFSLLEFLELFKEPYL